MSSVISRNRTLELSHRERLEALSGLMMGMFLAMLTNTVVTNALPVIVVDLQGSESVYSWVVVAALLAVTVSTPIWGKLSDIYSKKLLVQSALGVFVVGSFLAGFAQSAEWLIAARVVQGIGAGGLISLVLVVIATIVPPRERGRYNGYIGAALGIATLSGPLLGGLIVDASWLGWRWCFFVGVPFALVSAVLLQKTLHIPVIENVNKKIDYFGAVLLTAAVSMILIWVSLGGHQFAWVSTTSLALGLGGVLLLALAVVIEWRAENPVIPMHLFKRRTVVIAALGSAFVGVGMFAATVLISQFFQIARGFTPTESGLATLPMIAGIVLASTISGRLISKTGKWKAFLVAGGVLLTLGLGLLGTISVQTPYWLIAIYMAFMGVGTGLLMQNLVLAAQNSIALREIGAGSSLIAFSRTLGGSIGVSALGALVAHQISSYVQRGFASAGIPTPVELSGNSSIPDLATLSPEVRAVVESGYGNAIADAFMAAAPFALFALIAVLLVKEVPLRKTHDMPDEAKDPDAEASANVSLGSALTRAEIGSR